MSKIIHTIMMRKTKIQLIDLLEQQRQFIAETTVNKDDQIHKMMQKNTRINELCNDLRQMEGKYEHLATKHSDLNRELGRKDQEINQLKNVYMGALELNVQLLQEKVE